jgi:BirA family transcriptional regulator, biotin operon repressor / biotin---[acetyl-CoA-carboxylase] ligase
LADASLIIAKEQTSGHGRRGRKWISPPGNIYGSFVVRKILPIPQLTAIGALSALQTLRDCAPALQFWVKWPNDIYVKSLKIAGVLSETHSPENSNKPDGAVIGIGINLNVDGEFFEINKVPGTSIFAETGKITDIEIFAETLHANLYKTYQEASANPELIFELWKKDNILIGKEIGIIQESGYRVKGVFKDIDENGSLVLLLQDGSTRNFHSGEVSVRH